MGRLLANNVIYWLYNIKLEKNIQKFNFNVLKVGYLRIIFRINKNVRINLIKIKKDKI